MGWTTQDTWWLIAYVILFLIVGSNGIFSLIKWFKEKKYNDSEFKTRCKLVADLIECGVEIPKDFLIKVLRGTIDNNSFADGIKLLSIKQAKKNKRRK